MKLPFRPLQTVRGVAPSARWTVSKEVARSAAGRRWRTLKRRLVTGQVRVVEMLLGPRAASRYFWNGPLRHPVWFDVQRRVEHLSTNHRGEVDDFVARSLAHATDPTVFIGLASHPITSDATRDWLREHSRVDGDHLTHRLQRDRFLGGGVGAAARLVLEPDDAQLVLDWLVELYQLPDERLFEIVDSVGCRATSPSAAGSDSRPQTPPMGTTGHRVIISETFGDQESIAMLLRGAERTTLLALSDTFGKADFANITDWPGTGPVTVEHVRSRITRFSQQYVDLHESTARLAERVAERIGEIPDIVDRTDLRYLSVAIADFTFFQALKIRAVEELLADDGVEHVVVALGNHRPADEFPLLLSGVEGLITDPRVEFASISRSAAQRARFWQLMDALSRPDLARPARRRVPREIVIRKFRDDCIRLGSTLRGFEADDDRGHRPFAYVATTNNAAYNSSTAGFARELDDDFDVRILHVGRNATSLNYYLHDGFDDRQPIPLDFITVDPARVVPLATMLQAHLDALDVLEEPVTPADRAARWAFQCTLPRLTREIVAPMLAQFGAVTARFTELERAGLLPDLMVLTPQRAPGVGALASAARRFSIPTISLEPHAQDANYSRYVKITTDYYGVLSDHFQRRASAGLGISPDRTLTIGSPRQVAPPDYDPARAQAAARHEYSAETGFVFDPETIHLVFFCQPSGWAHVSKVWGNILEAARDHGCLILLKPHPEESVSRVEQYIEQATSAGMRDRVTLLTGDADRAIELGDIMLTAYSAAGIDAAMRQKPLICVTHGDVDYPVDIPAIVGAPMARSASELGRILGEFRADRASFERQARSLIERESQFVEGPGPRLRSLARAALDAGAAGVRPESDVPASLFLDGPHPLFEV